MQYRGEFNLHDDITRNVNKKQRNEMETIQTSKILLHTMKVNYYHYSHGTYSVVCALFLIECNCDGV